MMRRFKDDYEIVSTVDERGREKREAVYRGVYYEVSLDEGGLRRLRRLSALLVAVIIVLHLFAGFLNNRGMYQFYIALPYVFAFFPLYSQFVGILRLPKAVRPYRRDEVALSIDQIKTASKFLLIFLGVGTLGEAVYLLFFAAADQQRFELLFFMLEIVATTASFFLYRVQQPVDSWPIEEPQE
ncbi:MAG TPA: hypothetical protein VJ965_12400 [Anaerolineales bacterium]|nr:hypothetical protein [Anaerolineales bacterium]